MVVCATGYWESPFVFSLMTAVIAAGFARGFTFAINSALGSAAAVAVPYMLGASENDQALRRSAQWAFLLLLVAMVAGYARRIFTESERQQSLALDRLGRLVEANELLESLHRVAQSLPASLDLDDVLDSTMIRLHDLMEFDSAVLLVLDETDATWVAARRDGPKVPSPAAHAPAAASAAASDDRDGRRERAEPARERRPGPLAQLLAPASTPRCEPGARSSG